jgi:hypothetical protein
MHVPTVQPPAAGPHALRKAYGSCPAIAIAMLDRPP